MDPAEFRRHGHLIVDWIADHWQEIESHRITPLTSPGDVRRALPDSAPESGESFEAIMADFNGIIAPAMSEWGHPGWFAYFPSNSSPASVLGDMLAAGLGAQGMSWATSPAATELEQVVLEWLRQLLELPEDFTGVIQDTASTGTLMAFIMARERHGGDASKLVAYWSGEAHSSVAKAARLAGIPAKQQRIVNVDDHFALDAAHLDQLVRADIAEGLTPAIIVATMGTTSSTACDPLAAVGQIASRCGAWFHVDAAYGGTAAILPEIRPLLEGVELADSFVTNPHKWLMTSFDCSTFFVRDAAELRQVFAVNPEYLRTSHDDDVVNYRDWGIALGRRFRALKLWFVLRNHGADGLRAMLREHIAMAREFAGWIADDPSWRVLAPVPLGLVCFRHEPPELVGDEPALAQHNAALLARVNATGRVFLSHTTLGGRYAIRMAIGSFRSERRHVEEAWRLLNGMIRTNN